VKFDKLKLTIFIHCFKQPFFTQEPSPIHTHRPSYVYNTSEEQQLDVQSQTII